MVAFRYGIFLLVFNSTSHSFAALSTRALKIREMVSFMLGKEMEKDVFVLSPTNVGRRENISLFLYRAENFTISLNLFTNMTLSTSLIPGVCGTRVI